MPEGLWSAITPAYLSGIILSFLLELLLQPRPTACWRRPPITLLLHLGLLTLLFAAELLLFRRPWFAMANVLALQLFLVLVNNAKYQTLREPFISQDFEYFSDALKHPRLYLPFFGLARALLAITGILGAIIAGLLLEAPLHGGTVAIALGGLFVLGSGSLWLGDRWAPAIACQPLADLHGLGQLACLWMYDRTERRQRPATLPANRLFLAATAEQQDADLPDLVVVQSESFFDPRRCFSDIRPEILQQYDRLKRSATAHGRLQVPAWGANTVRTEYAFLSGLAPQALGIHRFNPYRWFARQRVPTLASFLRRRGYRTVCIHPYPADFYSRDAVYPGMGFDEFIDLRGFSGIVPSGPYIGDVALADKVRELLEEQPQRADRRPLFLFVITMENHGPLHLETIQAGEVELLHTAPPAAGCQDLTIYLRHLANADRMLGLIRATLEQSKRASWLCFFGDHLPIMPQVYDTLGEPEGDSDYLLWSNRDGNGLTAEAGEMLVEELAGLLIQQASLS